MNKTEQRAVDLANNSPVTQALRDNKSCIVVEKYEDWDVYAHLRIEKTRYTFWPKEIIEWWESVWLIENIVEHMIDPMGRKVEIHIMPFNWLEILK